MIKCSECRDLSFDQGETQLALNRTRHPKEHGKNILARHCANKLERDKGP